MFRFKQFSLDDSRCGMKLGTDSVALGAWTEIHSDARTALDIGAGSGILALMLAQRAPQLNITALESDAGASADCRINFSASLWSQRLNVVEGDFAAYRANGPVDLIISNPPYFSNGLTAADAPRAGARHEGRLNYATLIDYAVGCLSAHGSLAVILPADKYDQALYHAEMAYLKLRRYCWLRPSPAKAPLRIMMQLCRVDGHCERSELTVRDGATLSGEFAALTADFYL